MGIDPVRPIASARLLAGLTNTGAQGRNLGDLSADRRRPDLGGGGDRAGGPGGYVDDGGRWHDPDRRVRYALYESYGEAAPFWFADAAAGRLDSVGDALAQDRKRSRDHDTNGDGAGTGTVIDLAAAALGVRRDATQAEIDARFRAIVKAERPDLGFMDPSDLERITNARRVLSDQARTVRRPIDTGRWERLGDGSASGILLDLSA
ncbi:MAG: hypothetical protein AB7L13_21515 [Acidimicrobiia bacterium]